MPMSWLIPVSPVCRTSDLSALGPEQTVVSLRRIQANNQLMDLYRISKLRKEYTHANLQSSPENPSSVKECAGLLWSLVERTDGRWQGDGMVAGFMLCPISPRNGEKPKMVNKGDNLNVFFCVSVHAGYILSYLNDGMTLHDSLLIFHYHHLCHFQRNF